MFSSGTTEPVDMVFISCSPPPLVSPWLLPGREGEGKKFLTAEVFVTAQKFARQCSLYAPALLIENGGSDWRDWL
jgi:hypothetical protein